MTYEANTCSSTTTTLSRSTSSFLCIHQTPFLTPLCPTRSPFSDLLISIALPKAPHNETYSTSTIYGALCVNPLTILFQEGFIWHVRLYLLLMLLPRRWGAILAPVAKIYALTFLAKGQNIGTMLKSTWFFLIPYDCWPEITVKRLKWSWLTHIYRLQSIGQTVWSVGRWVEIRKNWYAPLGCEQI